MAGGFDSLGIMPELLRAIEDLNWSLPTDIQDEAIPLILGGGDVLAAAETGSGKTAAFCLPIVQSVAERLRDSHKIWTSSSSGGAALDRIYIDRGSADLFVRIDAEGLTCTATSDKTWGGGRANIGARRSGKYYYEAEVLSDGICRLGFATLAANYELGRDAHGFGYGGTGMMSHQNKFDPYGAKYAKGDTVGCFLDLDAKTIHFSLNGKEFMKAFDIPPNTANSTLLPAFALKNASIVFNFGAQAFRHPPSGDFEAINKVLSNVDAATDNATGPIAPKSSKAPLALILEPSRELAEQVHSDLVAFTRYCTDPPVRSVLLIAGEHQKKQERDLQSAEVVVGTLGRVAEMVKDRRLDVSQVRFFVLDEADKMIEADNIEKVLALHAACAAGCSKADRLQCCFFSATLHSPSIARISDRLCSNPIWVDLKGRDYVPDSIQHLVYRVDFARDTAECTDVRTEAVTDGMHSGGVSAATAGTPVGTDAESSATKHLKQKLLLKIVDRLNMSQCIIFCRTNLDCDNLETFLCNHGGGKKFTQVMETGKENKYSCSVLAGQRNPNQRRQSLAAFKNGNVRFLICTDLAARGIDIKGLPFCINMTLPDEPENYIHRIGRVGRSKCPGLAISIVAGDEIKEKVWYHRCASHGKACNNRKLVDEGGCAILYDETALLRAVETRLGADIIAVDMGSLDRAFIEGRSAIEAGAKEDSSSIFISKLLPARAELHNLESLCQDNFLRMTHFGKM